MVTSDATAARIAPQIIVALTEIITGGSGNSTGPSIGIYRSGRNIVRFFQRNGYEDSYDGVWSRVAHTEDMLQSVLRSKDGPSRILRLVENSVNPTDYLKQEEHLESAVAHLNTYLALEGLELRWDGRRHRISDQGGITAAAAAAAALVDALDFDACAREFARISRDLRDDPAGAITAASNTLESLAKTMLERLGEDLPRDQSVGPLLSALSRRLNLLPDDQDDQDIRRVMGGLASIVQGVGTLRTKMGSAHGRGDGHREPMTDLAELCVNAAAAGALFLLRRFSEIQGEDN